MSADACTPLVLRNGITQAMFLQHFPLPFVVRALTPWEARDKGLDWSRTWWEFVKPFAYVSDRFGRVDIAEGTITDFASSPSQLKSVVDDDSPTILFASAPHDKAFEAGGVLPSGREITFSEANELLTEAMYYCGSEASERAVVRLIVERFGGEHWSARGTQDLRPPSPSLTSETTLP